MRQRYNGKAFVKSQNSGIGSNAAFPDHGLQNERQANVIETYRMLGRQREEELLREAQRLHAGKRTTRSGRRVIARRRHAAGAASATLLANLRHAFGRAATATERLARPRARAG
jgi:hypothetical protein